ncbi:MAG: chemotaxis protein CheW [Methylophaga sp.]|nr:chemotaxis protein CheW [Methylophaga sp.]
MSISSPFEDRKPTQLLDQEQALSVYLKDMLLTPAEIMTEVDEPSVTVEHMFEREKPAVKKKDWRTSDFQTLIFDVQGLKLAIPLHDLNGILTWPEKSLSKIADKPDGYLGLYSQDQQHIQVIETANIVLPSKYQDSKNKSQFIICIGNGKWGLACNKIESVVTLSPDQVRWRHHPGKRPWLDGTVLEQMCSILNIEALIKPF